MDTEHDSLGLNHRYKMLFKYRFIYTYQLSLRILCYMY